MDIIPVIDIKDGIAVHALAGQRATYPPLVSRFAEGHDPVEIVQGLSSALEPRSIYIADLDAILRGELNLELLRLIANHHPNVRLLVDGGFSAPAQVTPLLGQENVDIVLGSESIPDQAAYIALRGAIPAHRTLLSLDRKDGLPMGIQTLFSRPADWPDRVINMNLTHVGGVHGPDLAGLRELLSLVGSRQLLAAGGVRGPDDLEALSAIGINAVLVGSALHDGRLVCSGPSVGLH